MFGRKHNGRRSTNILFVIFRLILSVIMFTLLLGGIYSAYKHFSGFDPLKLDPQSVVNNILAAKTPQQFLGVLKQSNKVLGKSAKTNSQTNLENLIKGKIAVRFLIVADSHNDNQNLRKAIVKAQRNYPDTAFIIGLGDYTDVGTTQELKNAKNELDNSFLRYFLVAGDHDLWDSRNKNLAAETNFKEVFGPLYQSFTYNGFKFLLLDNSDNYIGVSSLQKIWLTSELEKAKGEGILGVFVFIHEPLYHPFSDRSMGKAEKELKTQAEGLIFQLKSAGVKKIFSADTHYFSEYEEPVTKLPMVTIGALVTDRNPQAPRFAIVSVFEDGSTKVEDIQIK